MFDADLHAAAHANEAQRLILKAVAGVGAPGGLLAATVPMAAMTSLVGKTGTAVSRTWVSC